MKAVNKNNWFLYMVGNDCKNKEISKYTWGVGKCEFEPGIVDAPYGKMLVAPDEYIAQYFGKKGKITPRLLRKCILSFFMT